jgi:hypothetical protein
MIRANKKDKNPACVALREMVGEPTIVFIRTRRKYQDDGDLRQLGELGSRKDSVHLKPKLIVGITVLVVIASDEIQERNILQV